MSKIVSAPAVALRSRNYVSTPPRNPPVPAPCPSPRPGPSESKRFEDIEAKIRRLEDEMADCSGAMLDYKSKAAESKKWLIAFGAQISHMQGLQEIVEKEIAQLQHRQQLAEEKLSTSLKDLSRQAAKLDSTLSLHTLLDNRVQECEKGIFKKKDVQAIFPPLTPDEMDMTNGLDASILDAATLDIALDLHIKQLDAKRDVSRCKPSSFAWLARNFQQEREKDTTEEKHIQMNLTHPPGLDEDPSVLEKAHAQGTWNHTTSGVKHDSSQYVFSDEIHMTNVFDLCIWDASLFVGWPGQSRTDGILHVVITVIYFALMISMIYVIASSFVEDPYTEAVLERLSYWRFTEARDAKWLNVYDSASLVSRVCSDDPALTVATNQQSLYLNIVSYKGQGPLLCFCCLCIYCTRVMNDCKKSMFGVLGIWNLRSSQQTEVVWHSQGEAILTRVHVLRCVWCLTISLVRISLNGTLLYYGCAWLVCTIDIEKLLLNTIALVSILDLSEHLFPLASPHSLRKVIIALRPVEVPRFGGRQFIPLVFFVLTVGIVIGWVGRVGTLVGQMDEAHTLLCGDSRYSSYDLGHSNATNPPSP